MENTLKSDYTLPITFTKGNALMAWGILSLTMAAGMAIIMLIKGFDNADKEFSTAYCSSSCLVFAVLNSRPENLIV